MNNQKKKESKKRGRPTGKTNKVLKKEDPEALMIKKEGESDACDCFVAQCPGCWYECEICGSNKCSPFCRTARQDEKLEWKDFS